MLKSLRLPAAFAASFLFAGGAFAQDAAINVTGAAADPKAVLDVDGVTGLCPCPPGTARGMLIPRMLDAQRTAIPNTVGLLVYQTDDNGLTGAKHGYWYNNGNFWVRITDGPAWRIGGNAATLAAPAPGQYVGTYDAQPFVLRTNGVERMRFLATGNPAPIGINTTTPTEALEVNGGVRTNGTPNNATSAAGVLRYNTAASVPAQPRVHEGFTTAPLSPYFTAPGFVRLENAEARKLNQPFQDDSIGCAVGGYASWAGAPANSVNWYDTPFPTSTTGQPVPANEGKNWRVQYLFRGPELVTMGLCAGNITELTFFMVDDDFQGSITPPLPAAYLNFQVRAVTVPAATLNAFGNFYTPLSASAVRYAQCEYVIGSGQLIMPMTPAINWNGTDNVVIEIAYDRNGTGLSPRCQMQTGVGFNATRYGVINQAGAYAANCGGTTPTALVLNVNTLNGTGLIDSPPTFGGYFGLSPNRPVVRFKGNAQTTIPVLHYGDYVQYDGGLLIGSWGTPLGTPFTASTTPTMSQPGYASAMPIFRGPGTIHADTAVYDGNAQLSDHVFDRYFDGEVREEDVTAAANYNYVELDRLKDYLAVNRHLPNMPSREEWNAGGNLSLGAMATRLWETMETQALYIIQLENDLSVLEDLAYKRHMKPEELEALVEQVHQNPRLTQRQKEHLAATLRERFQDAR